MTNLDFLEESCLTVAVKNEVYRFRATQRSQHQGQE